MKGETLVAEVERYIEGTFDNQYFEKPKRSFSDGSISPDHKLNITFKRQLYNFSFAFSFVVYQLKSNVT